MDGLLEYIPQWLPKSYPAYLFITKKFFGNFAPFVISEYKNLL